MKWLFLSVAATYLIVTSQLSQPNEVSAHAVTTLLACVAVMFVVSDHMPEPQKSLYEITAQTAQHNLQDNLTHADSHMLQQLQYQIEHDVVMHWMLYPHFRLTLAAQAYVCWQQLMPTLSTQV